MWLGELIRYLRRNEKLLPNQGESCVTCREFPHLHAQINAQITSHAFGEILVMPKTNI